MSDHLRYPPNELAAPVRCWVAVGDGETITLELRVE